MAFERRVFKKMLPRTEKLFHLDQSMKEANACVVYVDAEYVVLDRTIFYAESGGQDCDTGFINNMRVVDVQDQGGDLLNSSKARVRIPSIKVNTIVVHKLETAAAIAVGDNVRLKIDWSRRKKLMKSHSTAHFIFRASQIVLDVGDDPLFVKGCHISEDSCRFDFSVECTKDESDQIEKLTNSMISEGGQIEMIPSEVSDEVFYWKWRDVLIPCGGTHVNDAAMLPFVRLSRSKKGSTVTRIKATFIERS